MPVLDKILLCQRKIRNVHDLFVVKVLKCKNIVGHLSKKDKLNFLIGSEGRREAQMQNY